MHSQSCNSVAQLSHGRQTSIGIVKKRHVVFRNIFPILFLFFVIIQQKNFATCTFSSPTNTAANLTIVNVSCIGILERYFVEVINFILPKKVVKPINFNSIFRGAQILLIASKGNFRGFHKNLLLKQAQYSFFSASISCRMQIKIFSPLQWCRFMLSI